MSALGDSLTQAYGAGGAAADAPTESWSTGSDAAVVSHAQRLVVKASISGRIYNDAVSGSTMSATLAQAGAAVSQGAGYVTILSGTNDVCTSTVAQMTSVATFSAQLQSTLDRLTTGLPNVRILVGSIPNWYGLWQAFHGNQSAQTAWTTYARCPDLLAAGATAADRAAVAQRIIDLNAAIATVCAKFTRCTSDGGAIYNISFSSADLAFDYFHFLPSGEAAIAAQAWPASFFAYWDDAVSDAGCGGCVVSTTAAGELQATVPGAADNADTAVGLHDFGGSSGQAGRVYSRDVIRLPAGQTLSNNLAIFQLLDTNGALVYELYLDSSRTIWLWSPSGGLRSTAINASTGFTVPNDGTTNTRIEVSALANNSLIVRVNDTDKITLTNLSGATSTNQRSLRAGIDHYDGTSTNPATITHSAVATSQTTWLGPPGGTPPPPDTQAPSVPAGVTATAAGTTSIQISWSASTDNTAVSGYHVYRDGGASPIATVTTPGYTDNGLTAGSTHSYTVDAFDAVPNTSAKSSPAASATTQSTPPPPDTQAPSVPAGVTATAAGTTSIQISWSASTDNTAVSGYHVYRDGGASPIATVTTPGYTDNGLTAGSTHSYTVDAFDAVPNTSAKSSPAASATTQSTPPSVPPGFESTVTDTGCGGCVVSTTAAGELQATVPGAADNADTAVGLHDFGGSSGQAGRVYSRDVIRLPAGQTLSNNLAIFQLLDTNGALVYELYLDSSRTIWLWSPSGGLRSTAINASTGFTVPNDGTTNTRIEVSALANNSLIVRVNDTDKITLTNLSGATSTNQRSLRAGIDHYDGTSTNPATITHSAVATSQTTWLGPPGGTPPPPDTQAPSVPAGVTATAAGTTSIQISWSASTDNTAVSGYHVYRDGGASPIATVTTPGYTDNGLTAGSTHSYTVDAFDAVPNTSAKSSPAASATTQSTPPSVPPGFESTVTDTGCGGCVVSTTAAGELQATVPGAADNADTAVGLHDFGGSSGQAGRVYSRDVIRLPAGQTLSNNLAIFQLLDTNGALVYELYLDSSRTIWLWSPSGGLRSTAINASTGFTVPNDGTTNTRIEVSALANNSLIVRVNDTDKITLTNLSGATSTNQRSLRAGIDHYDGTSTNPATITHSAVATSQTTWLGP